jgi:hypothetical protein
MSDDRRDVTPPRPLLDDTCASTIGRLVDGQADYPDDPIVGAHLRSCLTCFRAASDLREMPRICALLGAEALAFDPGESFWAAFPGRVVAAFEGAQAPIAPVPSALASKTTASLRRSAWAAFREVVRVLRRPWAAALTGAAAAGATVYLAAVPLRPRGDAVALAPAASGAPRTSQAAAPAPVLPGPASGDELGLSDEDELDLALLRDLDVEDLQALLRGMTPEASADAELDELGTATMAEEIEQLDEATLRALQASLGRSI